MDIAITRISSKGQIVIPAEMRQDIEEGEKLVIIRDEDSFVLKKAGKLGKKLEEDLEFSKRIRAAWKKYDKGEFKEMKAEEFIQEIKKW
jgi:AbrB family looped-hinge helix DNA binding protein